MMASAQFTIEVDVEPLRRALEAALPVLRTWLANREAERAAARRPG